MAAGLSSLLARILTGGDASVQGVSLQLGAGEFLYESASDNLTAHAGGGQASATLLSSELNRVTTVATAGDSVALPPSAPGLTVIVENAGVNPMQVYGSGTDTINGVASATGVAQMQSSVAIYTCYTAGAWFVNGLGTGYSGSLETVSSVDGITAHAGGGQAAAVALAAMLNRVATVATAGDSVKLPPSANGMQVVTVNAGANSMNVFPATGEQINALGANTAFAVAAGKTATFYCATAGQWHSILSA